MSEADGYLPFIESCLRQAAAIALQRDGARLASWTKAADINQVTTTVDIDIGHLLKSRIRRTFPQHSILDEESGWHPGRDPQCWIIDPLDGTSNYAAGSPLFGVMIALVGPNGVTAGGIALPAFGDCYVAQRHKGAFLNGSPLRTPPVRGCGESLVAYGLDKSAPDLMRDDIRLLSELAMRARGIRMSNSVFDICMVAKGVYAAFVHRKCRIWDVAAAHCLLMESGGYTSNLHGGPLDFSSPGDRMELDYEVIIAANGAGPDLATAASFLPDPAADTGRFTRLQDGNAPSSCSRPATLSGHGDAGTQAARRSVS